MILFGLTHVSATFWMNKVLQSFLDRFMVAYLKDIVIYNWSLVEHIDHLSWVFGVLRDNEFYVKKEKCSFTKAEVQCVGHIVGEGYVRMDPETIRCIVECQPPTKVKELRSFLGLANFYRRFVKYYSKITKPLTELLKKNKTWEWSGECQRHLSLSSEP